MANPTDSAALSDARVLVRSKIAAALQDAGTLLDRACILADGAPDAHVTAREADDITELARRVESGLYGFRRDGK